MADLRFFDKSLPISLSEIVDLVAGTVHKTGKSDQISGCSEPETATSEDIIFIASKKFLPRLAGSLAGAVLCPADCSDDMPDDIAVIIVSNAAYAFAQVARHLYPQAVNPTAFSGETGIHPSAHIHPTATLEHDVTIEAGAIIGMNVEIGAGTIIGPNAVIGRGCTIGRKTSIGPNASVDHAMIGDRVTIYAGARLGCDGFGFVPGPRGLEKIPQIGRVIIQDDVEIGANTCVDRGAIGDTVIAENTKIDNLVQIGHNVQIGRSNAIAAMCGISGSSKTGMGVMMGGRVSIADHITIGDGSMIGASSNVKNDLAAGGRYLGTPAKPYRVAAREFAAVARLGAKKFGEKKDD